MSDQPSVLVLGATGIIGRELCIAASRSGYLVYAVSRGHTQSAGSAQGDGIRYIIGDVYEPSSLSLALEGMRFDVIVDLLSFSPDQLERTLLHFSGKCQQYMFVSSATVYAGASLPDRLTEESERARGPWTYPALKIECEERLIALCAEIEQQFTIIRPYITYSEQRIAFGAWENDNVLSRIVDRRPVVIGNELADTVTSLTHSSDLARGIAGLMGNPAALNEDFHIASEEMVTWREVYEIAARVVGAELNLVDSSVSDVLRVFPELSGKVSDRLLARAFDNSKFFAACPTFSFDYTVRQGYSAAVTARIARGISSDLVVVGRLDRLVARAATSPGVIRSVDTFSRELRRESLEKYLRYSTGRRGTLYRLRRLARTVTSRAAPGRSYGIGR